MYKLIKDNHFGCCDAECVEHVRISQVQIWLGAEHAKRGHFILWKANAQICKHTFIYFHLYIFNRNFTILMCFI